MSRKGSSWYRILHVEDINAFIIMISYRCFRFRIMPSLGQHSIVDYVASDRHLTSCSSFVHVDSADNGSSDHLLLWVELGKVKKPRCDKKRE